MRSSLVAVCGFLALQSIIWAQASAPPTVISSPVGVTVHIGQAIVLQGAFDGTPPLTYQWKKNDIDIAGANSTTLLIPAATLGDAGLYHLVATNTLGSASTALATVLVTKRPQTITFGSTPVTASAGSSLTLTPTASSGLPVTLSFVSGTGSLMGNVLNGTGPMTVRAAQAGNATFAAAEPVEFTVNFIAGILSPFFSNPPADQTATAGTDVTFRSGALGTPAPTYQWRKDGEPIAGATGATLQLPAVVLADSGRYSVTATNLAGTATVSAVLTVRAAPVFLLSPRDTTVFAGSPVEFAIATTGFPAPTYQWRKNGVAVPGATNLTFSLPSAGVADAGRYDVVATNALGTATSSAATLVVNARDFAGTYFGQFAPAAGAPSEPGEFVLHVRSNQTANFLARFPGTANGIIAPNIAIDLAGNFSFTTPVVAAPPQTVVVRGSLDDATGAVTGTISAPALSLAGSRTDRSGTAMAAAGLYRVAVVGTATAHGYIAVAPGGEALVLLSNGVAVETARGSVGTAGRLTATSRTLSTVDVGFASSAVSGTIRLGTGASAPLSGALEDVVGTEHIANLSVRSATTPNAPLITGFVITGPAAKQVLIRAAGPTLAGAPFNVPGALADPTLQVLRGNTTVAQNNNWGAPAANATALAAAATRAGAFPLRIGSADAAVLTTLQPGAYTVLVGGGNGNVLGEIYEVLDSNEAPGARRLANVSARGAVAPGAPVIAGFVVSGRALLRVLIRGAGPALAGRPFNVGGALANPQLTLFRGSTAIKANDDWFRDPDALAIRDAAARSGAFAFGASSLDSAMVIYLEPGAYTAQVSPPANATGAAATGIVLVEVYDAGLSP